MADLTSVANVKQWLGLGQGPTDTHSDDTLLSRLVTGVSAWIQEWIGRIIATGSYTETLNGNGKNILALMRYPVTGITSVTIDGIAIPARTALGGNGYYFDSDFLYLDGYTFTTTSRQNVVVVYAAGFAQTPADLEQAAIDLVALKYRQRDRIGLVSKGMIGETTMFMLKDLPDDVQNVLQNYKRVVPTT